MILNLYKYNNIINDLLTFTTVDDDDDAVRRHCRVIHCRRSDGRPVGSRGTPCAKGIIAVPNHLDLHHRHSGSTI